MFDTSSRITPFRTGKPLPVLLLSVCLAFAGGAAAQDAPGAAAEAEIVTAPVRLDGEMLFRVRGVSSFPAPERARLIEERLRTVAADSTIPVESLRIVEGETANRIQAGAETIAAILDADARMELVGRAELSQVHLARMQQAIRSYRAARSPTALAWAGARVLAATLVFALAIFAVFWLRRRVDRFLVERMSARIRQIEIQSFEMMRAEQIWAAARRALAAIRTLVLVALALFYVSYVLAQIPLTRSLVTNIVGFALAPLVRIGAAVVGSIPDLVLLVVLFFVFRLAVGVLKMFFSAIEGGRITLENFKPEWAGPTYKIVRTLVIAFGIIVAYPYMPGSGSAAFQGVSLFLGVMVSLGASSAIANIVAGYMLIYRRAYNLGDRVKIGDNVGEVIEMRTQVTHLRSVKNEEVIIPNSQILSAEVINYTSMSKTRGLILHTEVAIGYETPWRQVEAMLVAAAERTTEIGPDTRPFVQEKKLGEFAVVYELNVYCMNVTSLPALYAALHRNILDVFNEYGIQIMTPAYEGDPEVPKVVPKKDWYTAPAVAREPARTER